MIYLDNAATSLQKPKEVEAAVIRAFHTMGNPGRGAHEATLQAGRCVYRVREQLAELFHAENGAQIAFTSNATEALNTAIFGLFHKGDHVITTVCEHNSVLRPLYRLQEEGVEVSFLSADRNGVLEYEKLPDLVKANTKGIVVTHASNLTGNITDLEKIREVAERRNLLLVVDGSQTAGILPVDVQKQGIDVFCFTGHKGLLGPQGTGGIYVRPGVEICPLKVGGSGIHSFDREHPKAMPEHLGWDFECPWNRRTWRCTGLSEEKGNRGDFTARATAVKTTGRTDSGDSGDSILWNSGWKPARGDSFF